MIYPKFLKPGDTIGICAPSDGKNPDDTSYDISLNYLKEEGYNVYETPNVRTGKKPSADPITRANDFNELMKRDDIDFIFAAAGGEFLMEMLPYVDDEIIKETIKNNKTKWFSGFSNPTLLLMYLTTKFDIATMYGCNSGAFSYKNLHKSLQDALKIIKGDIPIQESFDKCERISFDEESEDGLILNTDAKWVTPNGEVDIEGRLIGGCIDTLVFFHGTRFDFVKDFIERYKDDGIIWYFDNFGLSTEDLYSELWTLRESGWFKYAKGFVFGRTLFESSHMGATYVEAVQRALGTEIPIIMETEVSHIKPRFCLINGAIGHFKSKDGKGSLEMSLK